MGKKYGFIARVRDHRTGDTSRVDGTTEGAPGYSKAQAKADVQAKVREMPGRKTATDIELYG